MDLPRLDNVQLQRQISWVNPPLEFPALHQFWDPQKGEATVNLSMIILVGCIPIWLFSSRQFSEYFFRLKLPNGSANPSKILQAWLELQASFSPKWMLQSFVDRTMLRPPAPWSGWILLISDYWSFNPPVVSSSPTNQPIKNINRYYRNIIFLMCMYIYTHIHYYCCYSYYYYILLHIFVYSCIVLLLLSLLLVVVVLLLYYYD